MRRIAAYFRRETVFTAALAAALLSLLLTKPGPDTLRAIDTTTLCMLFSLMTVVAGLKRVGLFDRLRGALTRRVRTLRGLCAVLTALCFFLSMLATNDVALLTMVPFTLLLLSGAAERNVILTVVLETVAANLGSMVTPIGNPQNLYLYASGRLALTDFPRLTLPYALLSLALLLALCLFVPRTAIRAAAEPAAPAVPGRRVLYVALSAVALLGVFRVLPAWCVAAAVLFGALIWDREVLRAVDLTLLGYIVRFFVFSSGIKGYAPLRALLETMMGTSPLLSSLLTSQIISNVPACLLLAPFTQDAGALLLGVDLGGLGTLVASLASLISFKLYGSSPTARKGRYFGAFTAVNVGFLAALLSLALALGAL